MNTQKHFIVLPSGRKVLVDVKEKEIDLAALREFLAEAKAITLDVILEDNGIMTPGKLMLWGDTLKNSYLEIHTI